MGKGTEQTFFQRRYTYSQQAHEIYTVSLTIREMQIKTTVKYQPIPVRMVIIKKDKK